MKKLLILGGSRYVIPAIEVAHKLGVYVITCDYLPDNIGHRYSDEYHNVSIIDKEAVLDLAKKLDVDGIISFATDPGVVIAAYVAEKLGLPTPPYESVKILQNKDLFRNFLRENNFNVPLAIGFSKKEDAFSSLDKFKFPVIVKPVDSAGSKGVTRVGDIKNLDNAIDFALLYSRSNRFIIEEFIEKLGCSSDTDCFSINNKLVFASFCCQYFDEDAQNPYTPSGYTWPSDMADDKQAELRNELQRLIELLNLGTSIYNIETRVGIDGKAYIMEVSPRAGGNRLSEMLRYASGQDLIENNIRAALAMPLLEMSDPVYNGAWAEYILHSDRDGIFNRVKIAEDVGTKFLVEEDVWVSKGDEVKSFTGANETLGTLVLKFNSFEEAMEMLKNHKQWLKVIVD
ncbi:MAG: ATP-grasp domain-containing protein [Phascolarctobacterium sp.]|nr:ATP-grasp domain-containing protein [Phascolarctobacterium sp.]